MNRLAPIALLVALASPAVADPAKDKAIAEFAEGQRLFKAKDYAKAAEHFKAAFAADADPVYLFNVAQALRHAKQCAESHDYYERFLAAAGAAATNRDKVEGWMAEVKLCAAAQKPVEPDPVIPPTTPPRLEPPKDKVDPPPTSEPGRGRRRGGIVAIAGGVVAAGAGVLFVRRVAVAERDREALCPAPCAWDATFASREKKIDDRGKLSSTLAVASFATGGAALVAGVLLYVTAPRQREERIALTPTAGGGVVRLGFEF